MRMDLLADALAIIKNAEKVGKNECNVKFSKLIFRVLSIMKENGYIEGFKRIEDGRGGIINIKLNGKIIDCNVIKPRFSVKKNEYEKFEKRFLPASEYGILILTTDKGVMDHKKSKKLGIGGKLLAYVY